MCNGGTCSRVGQAFLHAQSPTWGLETAPPGWPTPKSTGTHRWDHPPGALLSPGVVYLQHERTLAGVSTQAYWEAAFRIVVFSLFFKQSHACFSLKNKQKAKQSHACFALKNKQKMRVISIEKSLSFGAGTLNWDTAQSS